MKKISYLIGANIILFCLAAVLLGYVLSHPNHQDAHEYRRLVSNTQNDQSSTPYRAQQERIGVKKELSFFDGPQQLKMNLKAASSQLILDRKEEGSSEMIEQMQNLRCLMQEELFYITPDGHMAIEQPDHRFLIKHGDPKDSASWLTKDSSNLKPMQIVRIIVAQNAEYFYQTNRFNAQNVDLSRYMFPGHKLVDSLKDGKLMMSGLADSVDFSLGGEVNFKATKLKAKFFSTEIEP